MLLGQIIGSVVKSLLDFRKLLLFQIFQTIKNISVPVVSEFVKSLAVRWYSEMKGKAITVIKVNVLLKVFCRFA